MPRLSVPISEDKFVEFNKVVPWGMRHDIIRRLVKMFMEAGHPLEVAFSDDFKIVRKGMDERGDQGHSDERKSDVN